MLGVTKHRKSEQIGNKKLCHNTNSWQPQLKDLCTVWVPSSQRCARRSVEHPEQRRGVSRVMAELLGEQDRTLQAGNGTTKDEDLQNNGDQKKGGKRKTTSSYTRGIR